LLGLETSDLAEYLRSSHGEQEEDIWISVFTEPFSTYIGDLDQVFDCRPPNARVELQADDVIFDLDGRDDVPKEVLLFRREALGYVCLAVVSVYPENLKEPHHCTDEEVPEPRHMLIGLVDNPVFRSLRFPDIRQRSYGAPSSENVEIPIPLKVLCFLLWCQTTFEPTKGITPQSIRGNPLQAATWCLSRKDAVQASFWQKFRYRGSEKAGQEADKGKFIYWS
jgi:hypothetical protein